MGGTNSSSNRQAGGLLVTVDKSSYKPGETVLGNVFIHMNQSFSANSLDVTLRVEEFTQLSTKKNNNNSKEKIGEKIWFDSTASLLKFRQNLISPGQYQFPFTFALPVNLPGSFEYYDDYNKAYIKYILEVKLANENPKSELKYQTLLIVNQPSEISESVILKEKTENLDFLCCIDRGASTLRILIPKESFYTNEPIITKCEVDNKNTNLTANNVTLTLTQHIILKDDKNKIQRISRHISSINYRHYYPKRESTKFITEMPILDYDNPTAQNIDKCDHLFLLNSKDSLPLMQASVNSDFIKCTYLLDITVFYDAYFLSSNPLEIEVPVTVYIPDVRINTQQFMPKRWLPLIYPIFKLNL